jgi:hypothetical protein
MEIVYRDVYTGNLKKGDSFEVYDKLYTFLENNNKVIVKKARQVGFTTFILNYLLKKAIDTAGLKIAIGVTNSRNRKEILYKIKGILDYTNIDIIEQNTSSLKICNSSEITIIDMSKEYSDLYYHTKYSLTIKELIYDIVLLDEAAFYEYKNKLTPTYKVIIASTPNIDKQTDFEIQYITSSSDDDYKRFEINWYDNSNFNINWYNNQKKFIDSVSFKAEILGEFIKREEKDITCSFRLSSDIDELIKKHMLTMLINNKSDYFRFLIQFYEKNK